MSRSSASGILEVGRGDDGLAHGRDRLEPHRAVGVVRIHQRRVVRRDAHVEVLLGLHRGRRSSSVRWITFSSWSTRVTRSRCCQCQSFHWASGTSFQTARGPAGKRPVIPGGRVAGRQRGSRPASWGRVAIRHSSRRMIRRERPLRWFDFARPRRLASARRETGTPWKNPGRHSPASPTRTGATGAGSSGTCCAAAADLAALLELTPEERRGLAGAAGRFRVGVTPYYASLMDRHHPHCPVRMQVSRWPPRPTRSRGTCAIPLGEDGRRPVRAVVHKYPDRALLLAADHCAVYCRHCTRRRITGGEEGAFDRESAAGGHRLDPLPPRGAGRDRLRGRPARALRRPHRRGSSRSCAPSPTSRSSGSPPARRW